MSSHLVTIGLPVFQGEAYLRHALDALMLQDFSDWRLIISDNASTDGTPEIARQYVQRDSRVSYFRHAQNIGAPANFLSTLARANSQYFMWAAADDVWSSNYVSSCLAELERCPVLGFCAGRVVNIDPSGASVRDYQLLGQELESPSLTRRIASYVAAREADGKANMIYSVFRTEIIQAVCASERILEGWGADMALVMAALARSPGRQIASATLYKRVTSSDDIATSLALAKGQYDLVDFAGNFPLRQFPSYLAGLLRGTPMFVGKLVVYAVMLGRLLGVVRWRLVAALRGR